ncbi:MAG: aminopeptidase [Eubacterium sp.]|nr:aminopeptidase [Eubacterium sp.]
MGYQEIFKEGNEEVYERYTLVMDRIGEICREQRVPEQYRDYFGKTAEHICFLDEILRKSGTGELEDRSLSECEECNRRLYEELTPGNYEDSYANPATAVRLLGEDYGGLLCFLYTRLRGMFAYAFEGRRMHFTIFCELFVEIYHCFEQEGGTKPKEIQQILYWFFHDYSEVFAEDKVRDMVDPEYDFFTRIVLESDLLDLRYLYRYGEYVSENEIRTAEFLNTLSEEEIQAMADTMTEGFRIGYEKLGKDLAKKETICMEYPLGFERMVRAAIGNFKKMGLSATAYRCPLFTFGRRRGCYTSPVNPQFGFDHKADSAVYLDKAYVERGLESMKAAYEKYKKKAGRHAGPAVTETFGEANFEPAQKPEAYQYSDTQQELVVYQMNCMGRLTHEYIPGDERSFTIIAYPIPEIGAQYTEIFRETVKLNTLDYEVYCRMQQKLIDVLDTAEYVHITGKGKNKTDLWVKIYPLTDPKKQTAFENCVADVNIPVGEVFTSPVLEGTNGKLHVTWVYLNGLKYQDLELDFTDGRVTAYSCSNFAGEEDNQRFLKENLMQQHDALPLGEFAIGTNTTAYRMAKEYGIMEKLPILIAEKTGPHFAIGDTCYSHAEETTVWNPDGKEVIAKDNSVSALRKEDEAKAYFNCHTDITIPYDELDRITVVRRDGSRTDVIRDGRFVVPGTEELNRALE